MRPSSFTPPLPSNGTTTSTLVSHSYIHTFNITYFQSSDYRTMEVPKIQVNKVDNEPRHGEKDGPVGT